MRSRKGKMGKKQIITIVIAALAVGTMCRFLKQGMEIPGAYVADFLQEKMEQAYLTPAGYIRSKKGLTDTNELSARILQEILPLYAYAAKAGDGVPSEDELMAELYRQREGSDEDRKEIEEDKLDYGKDALHIESGMLAEMERENKAFGSQQKEQEGMGEDTEKGTEERMEAKAEDAAETDGFVPALYPAYTYDWEEQWGYQELVSNFYAVDATTALKEDYVKLDELLYRDLSVQSQQEGPQILIYHTHSQEAFVDSVKGDASTTIVGAGEKLAKLLEEKYGFRVLHHTGEYDVENRDYAYSNSLPQIERILQENPSIEVVIDLHRDEMQEGKKLVMDLQGRPTARFMFFNGMSHIRNKGDISYLENPYIQDNLAFSFQAQVTANQYYPGIARKIYLKAYRYNLHLCPKSLLIELGAQTNTVEEIMNACDPLAHIISIVLKGEV